MLSGPDLVRFAWLTLWAILRIATNSRAFDGHAVHRRGWSRDLLLARPAGAGILEPGERHWDILRGLLRDGQAAGPPVMDAVFAAIALSMAPRFARRIAIFRRSLGSDLTRQSWWAA